MAVETSLGDSRRRFWQSEQAQTFWENGADWACLGDAIYVFARLEKGFDPHAHLTPALRAFAEELEAYIRHEAGKHAADARQIAAVKTDAVIAQQVPEQRPPKARIVVRKPRVVSSSFERCEVLMGSWPVVGVCRKPLVERLQWGDVRAYVDWDKLAKGPVRHVRMLSAPEFRTAKKRIFAVLNRAREAALKKAREKERRPMFNL